MSNYRPISNLSFLYKILEKDIYKQLYSYLNKFSMLSSTQSGFRNGHFTETALLKFYNDLILAALNLTLGLLSSPISNRLLQLALL